MCQYDDEKSMLPTRVHYDVAKHGCYHLDAINRTWIHLKQGLIAILTSWFVIDHTIEDTPLCDAMSKVAEDMVSELRVLAAANVIKQFV
ncbi:hypothetical protein TNCV_414691 [Trichonephila clavipes]|nr:hypothetical protein TNCV_414691 [Trichonephila clavipes]